MNARIPQFNEEKLSMFKNACYYESTEVLRETRKLFGDRSIPRPDSRQSADWISRKLKSLDEPINDYILGIDRHSLAKDSFRLIVALVGSTSGPLNPNLVNWQALHFGDRADAMRAAAIYLTNQRPSLIYRQIHGDRIPGLT